MRSKKHEKILCLKRHLTVLPAPAQKNLRLEAEQSEDFFFFMEVYRISQCRIIQMTVKGVSLNMK